MFFWFVRVAYAVGTVVLPIALLIFAVLARKRRRRAAALIAAALLCASARVYATHIEPRRLVVRRAEVFAGAPLRIVHLSDIQSDAVGDWEARVMGEVAAHEPDLVLHTGDLLHPIAPATVESELPKVTQVLSALAPTPVVTVVGDVDGWMRGDVVAGMTLLKDRGIRLPVGERYVSIFGLSLNHSAGGARALIQQWLSTVPDGDVTIVMGHRPDFAMDLAGLELDMALAGHTHGGQIRIPWFGPIVTLSDVPREWARGFRRIDNTYLNVSAGVGAEHAAGLPAIRVNCPPELTVIDMH